MNKKCVVWICVGALFLSGCGKIDAIKEKLFNKGNDVSTTAAAPGLDDHGLDDIQDEPVDQNEQVPITYDDSLIGEIITIEDSYTDEWGNVYEYEYHVPEITLDNSGANQLNQIIRGTFEPMVEDNLSELKDEGYMYVYAINYETHWTGDIISFVFCVNGAFDNAEYYTFTYDFANDSILANKDIIQAAGFTTDEYKNYARAAVVYEEDQMNSYVWMEEIDWGYEAPLANYYDYMAGYRQTSVKRLNPIEDVLFLDEGNLNLVATLDVPAGSGSVSAIVPIEKHEIGITKEVTYDYVTAALSDNEVTVTIAENDTSRVYLPDLRDDVKEGLKVKGLYSYYKGMFVGNMGQDLAPYLFLISDKNTIEMVNVNDCVKCGYYCAIPIPGVYKPETIKEEVIEEEFGSYVSVTCENTDGERKDFSDCWYYSLHNIPFMYQGSTWNSESFSYTHTDGTDNRELCFDFSQDEADEGYVIVDCIVNGDHTDRYEGYAVHIGDTAEGSLYNFNIHKEDYSEFINTYLMLDIYNPDSMYYNLRVKEINNTELFENANEWIELAQAYG